MESVKKVAFKNVNSDEKRSNIFHKSATILLCTNTILSIGFFISVILWETNGENNELYKQWKSCLLLLASAHNVISKLITVSLNFLDRHFCAGNSVKNKHQLLCAHSIFCLFIFLVALVLLFVISIEVHHKSNSDGVQVGLTNPLLKLCLSINCKNAIGIMVTGILSIVTFLLESILHYYNHKKSKQNRPADQGLIKHELLASPPRNV